MKFIFFVQERFDGGSITGEGGCFSGAELCGDTGARQVCLAQHKEYGLGSTLNPKKKSENDRTTRKAALF